ncbi:Dam family site-specific DNA-(adenine-N6)-methyltransferase [Campylobacter helveticus]|uniref:Dam family site-specific DNA-(adenine-N6)-methyltransferase n=1 Tax=Campylobacter helveticus TaxID=28898 RepID=UPI00214AF687|nr:Dam family site-specific DNA-(adenine-N6)-methyltransferase [Campylobacter helveticus]MCR2060501.1 Dam family site-specific DNA-(adenine-N6)-methyltransferase [Campylobacter helveticus]
MTKIIHSKPSYIKSPFNYIGGKYKILPQILPLFPKRIDTFIDVFCGGCNVAINVNAKRILANDNLSYLIALLRFLQQNPLEKTLQEIEQIIHFYALSKENAEGYKLLRQDYNAYKHPLKLLALLAFSFNHQIRFNNAHHFNTPFGRNRSSFNPQMKINLIDFIQSLQQISITFSSLDFSEIFSTLDSMQDKELFVYCDPPYLITQGTYNDGKRGFSGWNESLEKWLLNYLSKLDSKGILFGLSNVLTHKGQENKLLKQWLEKYNFYIHTIQAHYTNANYQAKYRDKQHTQEVFITNYKADNAFYWQ